MNSVKKPVGALVGFAILAACAACARPPDVAMPILNGEHRLRKMTTAKHAEGHVSGSFFLFSGSVSGDMETRLKVMFSWEMNDGTYAITTLPAEMIRIRLDDSAEQPTIRYAWAPYRSNYAWNEPLQVLIDEQVKYAVVTCKSEHWPTDISLPLNNPGQ